MASQGVGHVRIVTGGCQGTDAVAMYFAARKQIPFLCILPSFHPMKDDLEMGRYFEPWRITFLDNCHPHLVRGRCKDSSSSDTPLSQDVPLTARFQVEPHRGQRGLPGVLRVES